MKKTSLFLMIYLVTITVGVATIYSFNPFSSSDWEDAASSVVDTFKKGVSFLGKTFTDATDLAEEAFNKIVECSTIVGLGTKWAGQKAVYEAAQASLDAAEQSLNAAKGGAIAFNAFLDQLSKLAGKGINIKSFTFEAYTSKLMQGESPRITIEATIVGKNIKESLALDLSKPADAVKELAQNIIHKIGF